MPLPLHRYRCEPENTVLITVLKIVLERWRWRNILKLLARPKRFELPTPRLVVWCSIQLSYGRLGRLKGGEGRPERMRPLAAFGGAGKRKARRTSVVAFDLALTGAGR